MLSYARLRVAAFSILIACPAFCQVRLPGLISSHMVLQRDRPIHIWGWAAPDEKVTVTLNGSSGASAADYLGKWSVYLPPQPAGGPYQVTVAGSTSITLEDVLIGDVWFASGQSNMEMPLKGFDGAPVKNAAAEIAQANQPTLRLFHVPNKSSEFPLRDAAASWTPCNPETVVTFSAAAYFFGREITQREHVPVGLIDASWGGTPAEAWVSLRGISSDASLMPVFAARNSMMEPQDDVAAMYEAERREDQVARQAGRPLPHHDWHPNPPSWAPAGLYNGLVAPVTPYAIKGVIWYQGETNSRRGFAPTYAHLFPALIADWRSHWHSGNFPFIFVQIANFKSGPQESWATVREAQRRTLSLANTAMVVTTDIGDPDNVHPADKQSVGARLALAARAIAYGEHIEYSGPLFRQATPENGAIRVWFDHADGLTALGSDPQSFELEGEDGKWVSATAHVDGKTVIVSSPQVAHPKQVRYGWANAPVCNLYNSAQLPASPFTSEDVIPAP